MNLIVQVFGVLAIIIFILGYYQSIIKKNPFQKTPYLLIFGIFVWGDAIVLGLFGFLVSLIFFIKILDSSFLVEKFKLSTRFFLY